MISLSFNLKGMPIAEPNMGSETAVSTEIFYKKPAKKPLSL
jgi:hypothetical protein